MHDYRKVWEEPARGGYPDPSALALSGLDRMRAMVKGQIPNPPISHLIGMRPVEAGVGEHSEFKGPVRAVSHAT